MTVLINCTNNDEILIRKPKGLLLYKNDNNWYRMTK